MNEEQFEQEQLDRDNAYKQALARVEAERDAINQKLLAKTGAHEFLKYGLNNLVKERDTAQAQLAEVLSLYQQIRHVVVDNANCDQSGKYHGIDDAFMAIAQAEQQEAREPVLARPEHGVSMDEALALTMDRYSGAMEKLAASEQQEAQGAQAGDLASAVRVLLEVPQLQGEQAFSAQPIIDRVRAALATQPAVQDDGSRAVGPTHPYREEC